MKTLLKKFVINTIAVISITQIVTSFRINGDWQIFLFACFILTILFSFIRPIVNIILLPINLLTLNMSAWILNLVMIFIWTLFIPEIKIDNWEFTGASFWSITLGANTFSHWQVIIIISIMLTVTIKFFEWLFE